MSLFPPFRFGVVEDGLYRGAYPKPRNLVFLETLNLKTIISLTPNDLSQDIKDFATIHNIKLIHIQVNKSKENVPLSYKVLSRILLLLVDSTLSPLYIHCLDGTLVTGVVIMSLRKIQMWDSISYYSEASRFLKEENISFEEKDFVDKFTGNFF